MFEAVFWTIIILLGIFGLFAYMSMSPEERRDFDKKSLHGNINPQIFCPHCQSSGKVRTKKVTQKKGIHGGKATGAVLTGGVSLLATGLSRKEGVTRCYCENCNSEWYF